MSPDRTTRSRAPCCVLPGQPPSSCACFSTNSTRWASSPAYPHWCVAPAISGITVLAGEKSLSRMTFYASSVFFLQRKAEKTRTHQHVITPPFLASLSLDNKMKNNAIYILFCQIVAGQACIKPLLTYSPIFGIFMIIILNLYLYSTFQEEGTTQSASQI